MAADCHYSRYSGAAPPIVMYTDDETSKMHASAEHTVYIRVSGPKMRRLQLGSDLHRFFNLEGRVEVSEQGYCRFSAKFSNQRDYNEVTRFKKWKISDRCSIDVYEWKPNIQFSKVPLVVVGDIVEARLEGLPVEYCTHDAVRKIGYVVCAPFGCNVSMVDISKGKPARFLFQWMGTSNCGLDLPLHVQVADGPLVGLTYSRAQRCYGCGRFGHIRRSCPDHLNQRTYFSSCGPINQVHAPHLDQEPVPISDQVHAPHLDQEPVPISDQVHAPHLDQEPVPTSDPQDTSSNESSSEGSTVSPPELTTPERQEETNPVESFSVTEYFARSSGTTSPPRPIRKTEMSAKGAILVENGVESRSTLYNIEEEVSGIDGTLKVTHLNDQRGNRRQVNITPRTGHVLAPRCSKRLVYMKIEDADDRIAIRGLKDTCDENDVSMAILIDKSSVLCNDDQIVRRFGFSAYNCTEMIFRSFGPDGLARDVKGNLLLMWKKEELHVNVSPVLYGNTELLSQHFEFSASWVVNESVVSGFGEQYSDESSHGFSSSEEGSFDFSDSTDNESPTSSPYGDESSLFSTSGEECSKESSVSGSSSTESSIFPPNGDESSIFSTDGDTELS